MTIAGKEAESMKKRESTRDNTSRTIDCIGWTFNLTWWSLDVAKHNRQKALYLFWATDLDKPVTLKKLQAMSSMASRYALVYRELAFLVGGLYKIQQGDDPSWLRHFDDDTKVIIYIWRAYLVKSEITEPQDAVFRGRHIDTFTKRDNGWILEFDGSLKGIGARVFKVDPRTGEEVLLRQGGIMFDFDLEADSSYQNASELIAAFMVTLAAIGAGCRNTSVTMRGDSVVVLAWNHNGTFNSKLALAPSMIMVAIAQEFDIVVDNTIHIPDTENTVCDKLSRNHPLSPGTPVPNNNRPTFIESNLASQLVALANPLVPPLGEGAMEQRMFDIRELLREFAHLTSTN
jgi:hypothetical protein